MKRFAALGLLAFALTAAMPAASASAQSGARVVIVTLDGTSLDDWLRADTFHLRRAIHEGTPGLLSARTGRRPLPRESSAAALQAACLGRAGDALATMLLGVRATSKDLNGTEPLRTALARAGISIGTPVAQQADSSFPTGRRTDYARLTADYRASKDRLVLMRIGDTLAADCAGGAQRDRWVGVALGRADAIIGAVRASLAPHDRLIVLSGAAPWNREQAKNYLAAATVEDATSSRTSVLTSDSTRRRGVVTLADTGTTVARLLGVDATIGVGRPWQATGGSAAYLRRAAADYAHASAIRSPLLRGLVWCSVALLAMAALTVVAGRGRARGGRVPRTWRDAIALSMLIILAAPFAIAVEPLLRPPSPGAGVAVATAIAVAVALCAAAVRGLRDAAGVCAAASAAATLAFLGDAELGARTALSYSVAGADRFYGIGNEMMGAGLAATLLAVGALLDRRPRAAPFAAAVALIVTVAMAAPPLGAKFGSVFVAVPAFGAMMLIARGGRITREGILGVAIATVLLAGIVAAWDHLAAPQAQTHIARAAGDTATLGRKAGAALRLAAGSYWTAAVLIPALIAAALARRRSALLARGLWGMPHRRAALAACVVAATGSIAFNDAGVIAAALTALAATAALLHALLCGQTQPLPESARSRRLKEFVR